MVLHTMSSTACPKRISGLVVLSLIMVITSCSIYANLSFAVTDRANLKYFPPFEPFVDANANKLLGAEYFNIAVALAAGKGFANPFGEETGPTAWMAPVLPTILAGLLWAAADNHIVVTGFFIVFQVSILIGTGILVLTLAREATSRLGTWATAVIYLIWVADDFYMWFQRTHDYWLILLAVDILVAGLCWYEPLKSKMHALRWGFCGGIFALINPIVAFCWGVFSVANAHWHRTYYNLSISLLAFALTMGPWIVPQLSRVWPLDSGEIEPGL